MTVSRTIPKCLAMARIDKVVRDQQRWVIQLLHIDNVWFTGEPAVLLGEQ